MQLNSEVITVITIVLNDVEKIEDTIKSVINQSYKLIEYIIIDGGSIDGTISIIERYQDRIALSISESDNGIYNAMNKGIHYSHGDYIIFVNSGDILYSSDIIERVFSIKQEADFIIGDVEFISNYKKLRTKTPLEISFYLLFTGTLYHQATFTKKAVFDELGGYNESNRITSDWEFITIALTKYNKTYKIVDYLICKVDSSGISSLNPELIEIERSRMLNKHFKIFLNDYFQLKKNKDRTIKSIAKKLYRIFRKQHYQIRRRLFSLHRIRP